MKLSDEQIDEKIIELIEDIQKFGEFILIQDPSTYGTDVLVSLNLLSNAIKNKTIKDFTVSKINELQEQILNFYINWNPKITKQVCSFYNAYVELTHFSESSLFKNDNHPFTNILKNMDRFERANIGIENIIKKYDFKSLDEIEFYSYFFAILIMSEAQRHYFQKDLEFRLKNSHIVEFKINEIFSLTNPWKNDEGKLTADITMLRNAIAHFKFKTEYDVDNIDLKITFFPEPDGHEETRILYAHEIVDFVGYYRYLLQTFQNILFLMFIFSTIRQLYLKK